MALGFKVTTKGDQEVTVYLNQVGKRMINLQPAMKQGRVYMLGSINRNFERGGRPVRWQALSMNYYLAKLRAGYGNKTLIRTGQLKRSITGRVEPTRFIMGTAVPYARIHQFGGTVQHGARTERFFRQRKKTGAFKRGIRLFGKARGFTFGSFAMTIPARPFILFQDEDITALNTFVLRHLTEKKGG